MRTHNRIVPAFLLPLSGTFQKLNFGPSFPLAGVVSLPDRDFHLKYQRGSMTLAMPRTRGAHCWVVTPWSFLSLLGQIVDYYKLAYELHFFETTPLGQLEFYVQLRRSSVKTDWAARAKQAERENNLIATAPVSGLFKVAWKTLLLKLVRLRKNFPAA